MSDLASFWRQRIFSLAMIGCALFVVLTIVAMVFYSGGTLIDSTTSGYSLTTNYFSDLGLTRSHARQPNTVSAILFIAALTMAGTGLILFFFAFPQFFFGSRWAKLLSVTGSTFGVIAGLCFIRVALMPANLYLGPHITIMMRSFGVFAVAAICYTIAIFRQRDYPNAFGFVFVASAVLLALYVVLLTAGPPHNSPEGIMIQAIGQKIIVYASVVSVFVQAYVAKRIAGESINATHS